MDDRRPPSDYHGRFRNLDPKGVPVMNDSKDYINPHFCRKFQYELLHRLAKYYPHRHVGRWNELHDDENIVKVNVFYLMGHGLIDAEAKAEKRFGGRLCLRQQRYYRKRDGFH